MIGKTVCILCGILFLVSAVWAAEPGEDPVIAIVGGMEIHRSELDRTIEKVPPVARANFQTIDGQMKLLERMIRTKAMMKAAEDAGYLDRPEIQDQLKEQRERILAYEYFKQNISTGPIPSESDLIAYYEKFKDQDYKLEKTADIQQIVIADENEAKRIRQSLESKEMDFGKAVETYSIDETRETGGMVAGITENGFIRGIGKSKPFTEMVFKLKADEISEPFKSNKGWHLVKLVSLRNSGYRPFEDVRSDIAKKIMVTEDDIRKEYEANPEKFQSKEQCSISHILLETEEQAESVFSEFSRGKDFAYLVKTYSKDAQTADKEGNLGTLTRDGYVRGIGKDVEFENAVFALKQGEVSRPIKTRKGWHLVRIDEKLPAQLKPLTEVEASIRQALSEKKIKDFEEAAYKELEKKYEAKVFTDRLTAGK